MKALLTVATVVLSVTATGAQAPARAPERSGSDPQFKVRLDFNRWHDTDEIKSDLRRLEKAWPKFLKYSSLGKSYEGRDMMLMTINNPDTGPELGKPAMYIEANVHGNEIQGGEVSLYTVWYLMENYDRIPQIKKLVRSVKWTDAQKVAEEVLTLSTGDEVEELSHARLQELAPHIIGALRSH